MEKNKAHLQEKKINQNYVDLNYWEPSFQFVPRFCPLSMNRRVRSDYVRLASAST